MRYYKLWPMLAEGDAILRLGPGVEPPFDNWLDPTPWDVPVAEPLTLEIEQSGRLLPYYRNPVPIMSEELLARLRDAGVDNIDDYEVVIIDPEDGRQISGYRALKIVGAISAADPERSEGVALDDSGLAGTFFDRVIIDESKTQGVLLFRLAENLSWIVVAERVKQALLAAPEADSLRFTPLFEIDDEEDDEEEDPDLDYDDLGGDVDEEIDHD